MIWTLKIECVLGRYLSDEWVRVIEIDSRTTLSDIHEEIQDEIGFDRDHLFEFFAGRNTRKRDIDFAGEESWAMPWGDVCDRYSELKLENIYPLPKGLKLFYHFDFGDDWYFKINKSRKKPREPEAGVQYPRIVKSIGPNPDQYGLYDEEF